MKNLSILVFGFLLFGLFACGNDGDCVTCEGADPLFGIEFSSEACENGDGTITVTGTALGITSDTTYVSTLEDFITENETVSNATCN